MLELPPQAGTTAPLSVTSATAVAVTVSPFTYPSLFPLLNPVSQVLLWLIGCTIPAHTTPATTADGTTGTETETASIGKDTMTIGMMTGVTTERDGPGMMTGGTNMFFNRQPLEV